MNASDLPTINALLNATSTVLLVFGYIRIKQDRPSAHGKFMISAVICSALFLTSYLIYHSQVGSVPYPRTDWTRYLYYAVLIPHVILAALMTPGILAALWFALRGSFDRHRRLTRWVWPVWMFVSASGVVIYLMLYRL